MLKRLFLVSCLLAVVGGLVTSNAAWAGGMKRSQHDAPGSAAVLRSSDGFRVKLRLVEELPNPTAAASVTRTGTDAFAVDIKRSALSADILAVSLKALGGFAKPAARFPRANIVVYVSGQASAGTIQASERIRLEAISSQLKGMSRGAILEIVQPK